MRILFFGTPEIASPFLEDLLKVSDVVGVVTQPDRPADRGKKLHQSAVKVIALQHNIPVFQPEKFTPPTIDELKNLKPDAGVVVSYGKLIPEEVFNIPLLGSFNVHFSLLPKYRGAAPVQWAIVKGEKETGITTFRLEKSLDTGPIFIQKRILVADEDDADSIFEKLIPLGVGAVRETMKLLRTDKKAGTSQSGEPSYARCIVKEDGRISWEKPTRDIFNLIRGLKNWPGAFVTVESGSLTGKTIKILKASVQNENAAPGKAGTVIEMVKQKGFIVLCGKGSLLVETVHPQNKNPMPAWDFIQGGHLKIGDVL